MAVGATQPGHAAQSTVAAATLSGTRRQGRQRNTPVCVRPLPCPSLRLPRHGAPPQADPTAAPERPNEKCSQLRHLAATVRCSARDVAARDPSSRVRYRARLRGAGLSLRARRCPVFQRGRLVRSCEDQGRNRRNSARRRPASGQGKDGSPVSSGSVRGFGLHGKNRCRSCDTFVGPCECVSTHRAITRCLVASVGTCAVASKMPSVYRQSYRQSMTERKFTVLIRRWPRRHNLEVRFNVSEEAGSHGTLWLRDRKTTVKDRKKETGPGLLAKTLDDLGIKKDELQEDRCPPASTIPP